MERRKKIKHIVEYIMGIILTFITYILCGWDIAIETLIVFIALDLITGICKAIVTKKLSSNICIKGIVKKIGYLILVALSVFLERLMDSTGTIRTFVIYSFVANEGISILENWVEMKLPIPSKIKDILYSLNNSQNKTNDK